MGLVIRSSREALQPFPAGTTHIYILRVDPILSSKKKGSHTFCFFIVNWRENKEMYQTTLRHLTYLDFDISFGMKPSSSFLNADYTLLHYHKIVHFKTDVFSQSPFNTPYFNNWND